MYEHIHMPIHRSITRVNRNENKESVFNICCGIILLYLILSLFLSSQKLNAGVIFLIIIGSFSCGTCIVCICIHTCYHDDRHEDSEDSEDSEEESIPTITAYPIGDNEDNFQSMVPVVCTPVE